MAAPKAKPKLKIASKAAPKKTAKTPVKAAAKKAAAPKKKPAAKLALVKPAAKPKATAKPPAPKKFAPQKKESFFERMLREKAERHAQFQKQNEHGPQGFGQKMPANHASFSKFAGPRRRAS